METMSKTGLILVVFSGLAGLLVPLTPAVAESQDFRFANGSRILGTQDYPENVVNRGTRSLEDRAGVELNDVPVADALHELQSRAGMRLLFSPSLFPPGLTVSCACRDRSIREALSILLDDSGFWFSELGSHVMIERVEAPSARLASFEPRDLALSRVDMPARRITTDDASRTESRPQAPALIIGTITGRVTHADTGEGLSVVQVSIQGTGLGTLTGVDGTFSIPNVPAGVHTVLAQRIGFIAIREEGVQVASGGLATLSLVMRPTVLTLQEIVATGLVDPVEGVRSPVSVARVNREMMPVNVQGSALQNLQGRVAGLSMTRSSFEPGGDINVMLRSPTSGAAAFFGSGVGDPLIVVDGVILGSGGTSAIESMDIENIEVIKGAAAASLYGSRAAAGVIAITTARGSSLELGQTRFAVSTEMGTSFLNRVGQALEPSMHHPFLMDEAKTTYVDLQGNPVSYAQRVRPAYSFMVNPYPGQTYDNISAIFQPGNFQTQNFSLTQNTMSTNFAITLNRYLEEGLIPNNDGFERGSFRVNLDHRFRDGLSVGVSAFHSRDRRDNLALSLLSVIRAPVAVDLKQRDEDGRYIRIPDPQIAYENPLWIQESRENDRKRSRTLASANLRWDPAGWLSLQGSVSYDHSDSVNRTWIPKGIPVSLTTDAESTGSLTFVNGRGDTGNAELQASVRRDYGALNVRTTIRGIGEFDRQESVTATGQDFFVESVPRLNAAATSSTSSETQEVQSLGYLLDTAFDYDGKYILTLLGRRDGSSLFGPDNRWHTYYRAAGAWRVSQENWFNVRNLNELKISFARGTAGGRPPFFAQYETWQVGASGVSKGTLGNRNLRPEHTLEQELSVDMILYDRFGIKLTHAWQTTSHQLILTNVPSFTGYREQWINGGDMHGHTTELTLEADLIRTPRFGWNALFVADRSRARTGEWPGQCLNPSFRFVCENESAYSLWAGRRVTDFEGERGLKAMLGGQLMPYLNQFVVNDDGYMVWVGEGNHYTDHLWGESAFLAGTQFFWGMTFDWLDEEMIRTRTRLGDASHVNFGLVNNFTIGRLSLHAHVNASIGGETFNTEDRSLIQSGQSPRMDQSKKPQELWKPMEYYESLVPYGTPQIESLDYLKLRALQATWRFDQPLIERLGLGRLGFTTASVGIVGRELLTLTKFTGPDPELGLDVATRSISTGGGYPPSRTVTATFELTF